MSRRGSIFLKIAITPLAVSLLTSLGAANADPPSPPVTPPAPGQLQCWYPEIQSKTCQTIFEYRQPADENPELTAHILLAAMPAIEVRLPLAIDQRAHTVCARAAEGFAERAELSVDLPNVTDQQRANLRANVDGAFRHVELCWSPVSAPPYIWISPEEGYTLARTPTPAFAAAQERISDPLLEARNGYVQCETPNYEHKSCWGMSTFAFEPGGQVIETRRLILGLQPLTVATVIAPVTTSRRSICSSWSSDTIDSAQIEIGGRAATAEEAHPLRDRWKSRLFADGSCLPAPPPVSGDLVNGIEPLSPSGSAWVRADDGFSIACVSRFAWINECGVLAGVSAR